jgi:hypothetical protein
MRPVNGAFRVRNTASYFIQEVGRWNWTVKGSYEVSGESIQRLRVLIKKEIFLNKNKNLVF